MCCDSPSPPPAPDYSGIAAANSESARYSKEAADNDLAFRRQVYDESKPGQAAMKDLATRVAESQLGDAETARGRGAEAYGDWQKYGRQLQQRGVDEANAYGGEADQVAGAGRAISDVRQQAGLARGINSRAMTAMGVNPNSGRFAGLGREMAMTEAGMAAGGANNARVMARDKGIGLRAGALAGMTGQQNVAGQNIGLATASGNSGVGNANAGFRSGLPYAQFATGATGHQIAAAGQGIKGILVWRTYSRAGGTQRRTKAKAEA